MSSKGILGLGLLLMAMVATGAEPDTWRDPSPHRVQFIEVDKDVTLEVLDWGGTGRPVVLLTGLGNSAHVYDDFAPKLVGRYHVYGITRRGFGASSVPESGYGADRLGDDVLSVLDQLKIAKPVLVGHSLGGEELSSISTRHADRIAGLVYLDAAYSYAYHDADAGREAEVGLQKVQRLVTDIPGVTSKLLQLQELVSAPGRLAEAIGMLLEADLPRLTMELREAQDAAAEEAARRPDAYSMPGPADLASFETLAAWFNRTQGYATPASELRAVINVGLDGRPMGPKTPPHVQTSIMNGMQEYSNIRNPTLAIYAVPDDPAAPFSNAGQIQAFEEGVPQARVVRIPGAHHYVYISNEAQVLREMQQFIDGLPKDD